jgi:hypothetical protein
MCLVLLGNVFHLLGKVLTWRLFQRDGLILPSSIKIARNCHLITPFFILFLSDDVIIFAKLLPQQHPLSIIVLIYNTSKSSMFLYIADDVIIFAKATSTAASSIMLSDK